MNFEIAIKTLNTLLEEKRPEKFSSSWIFKHKPYIYHFFRENFRTETGDIDWDIVTLSIDRSFLKRWVRYKKKSGKPYENQDELNLILTKYKDTYYTLIAPQNEDDRRTRDRIAIALVRVSQKGNVLAEQELTKWMKYVIDDWVEKYYPLFKWKGYADEVEGKIALCIKNYKYTGSFTGYMFKTLQYSARGMQSREPWSLDDPVGDDGSRKIDFVSVDQDTGIATIFGRQ